MVMCAAECRRKPRDSITVVKSAKDKRYEELEGTIRLIENAEKLYAWDVI